MLLGTEENNCGNSKKHVGKKLILLSIALRVKFSLYLIKTTCSCYILYTVPAMRLCRFASKKGR